MRRRSEFSLQDQAFRASVQHSVFLPEERDESCKI